MATQSAFANIYTANKGLVIVLLLVWCSLLAYLPDTLTVIADHIAFTLLGVLGAIFANATGAGGGVVFIPAFEQLDFTVTQAVATSFGIQCMGMTTGALAWARFYRRQRLTTQADSWQPFLPSIAVVAPCSVAGLWLVYGLDLSAPGPLNTMFAWFSLVLGSAILATSLWLKPGPVRNRLDVIDIVVLVVIGMVGGAITAWLSVGVGEIMAIYLILRRYNAIMAVASAVVVTAVTVLCGIVEHLMIHPDVYWQVVLFAGPGAIFGAILARRLASRLPVRQLKLLFAGWVLCMGLPVFF